MNTLIRKRGCLYKTRHDLVKIVVPLVHIIESRILFCKGTQVYREVTGEVRR